VDDGKTTAEQKGAGVDVFFACIKLYQTKYYALINPRSA
jgi:hypothetical protein